MNELQIRAVLAGVLFGIWPLLMNRSGLNGNVSSAVFSLACLAGTLPFALWSMGNSLATANWPIIAVAGVLGALGLLFFNGMLAKATSEKVGTLIVLAIVAQISIPALYQVVTNGGLTVSRGIGFAAAVLAAFLLL